MVAGMKTVRGLFCLATVITVLAVAIQVWFTIHNHQVEEHQAVEDPPEDWTHENLENVPPLEAIVVDAQGRVHWQR